MNWEAWTGTEAGHTDQEAREWAATQPRLYQGSTETIRVYRGVECQADGYIPGCTESWTTSERIARSFGETVLTIIAEKGDIVFENNELGEQEVVLVFDTENYDYNIEVVERD